NPHPEKQGCTCDEGEKLTCPVHGLNPDPMQQGYDHSWSVPEGHPVGYPESGPRNYYMKAEGAWNFSGDQGGEQDDTKANSEAKEYVPEQRADDRRKANQDESSGIDVHQRIVARAHPAWLGQWIEQ